LFRLILTSSFFLHFRSTINISNPNHSYQAVESPPKIPPLPPLNTVFTLFTSRRSLNENIYCGQVLSLPRFWFKSVKKFRILIVEDNAPFRQILKETLQTCFSTIAIDEAADGGEALQKVDAFLPDLILMDIRLPGENGLELTKKIKATHPNITILILTSYDMPEYREAAFQYGADRFLSKTSLDLKELKELVKSYQKV